ncbi:MAG: hypothetical protein M3116_01595 [Actinomycetota bacterium]|nr:hypothetical protein [Actinomycetota bacterium]
MPSLIQQRIALDRERAIALWLIIAGSFFGILGLVSVVTAPERFFWGTIAMAVFPLLYGIFRLWAYRQSRKAFEAEHGPHAGKQTPVGR